MTEDITKNILGNASTDVDKELYSLIGEVRLIFEKQKTIHCPFFNSEITLNSDGLNHLLYKPNRMPRVVAEQKLKLRLVKKALSILKRAGTVQENRIKFEKYGSPGKDGFTKTKQVEYWAFHDIVGEKKKFVMRVIVRKVGDGKLVFWSVMPNGKIERQKLYKEGLDEE